MRIDYFLKVSRLVKRRTLAKEMCDKHLVQINAQVVKAGKEVQVGDVVTVKSGHRTLNVRVDVIPERAAAKKDTLTLYTVIEDIREKKDDILW